MSELSRSEQLRVLTGCGLPRGKGSAALYRRMLVKVLAEVAHWIRIRQTVADSPRQ
jgi:hypothetical protein